MKFMSKHIQDNYLSFKSLSYQESFQNSVNLALKRRGQRSDLIMVCTQQIFCIGLFFSSANGQSINRNQMAGCSSQTYSDRKQSKSFEQLLKPLTPGRVCQDVRYLLLLTFKYCINSSGISYGTACQRMLQMLKLATDPKSIWTYSWKKIN